MVQFIRIASALLMACIANGLTARSKLGSHSMMYRSSQAILNRPKHFIDHRSRRQSSSTLNSLHRIDKNGVRKTISLNNLLLLLLTYSFKLMFSHIVMPTARTSNFQAARSKRWLHCAATFGSLAGSSHAFVVAPTPSFFTPNAVSSIGPINHPHVVQGSSIQHHHYQTMRLFFSKNNQDDDWSTIKRSAGNLVRKGAEKIKSILPFGKTAEEKQAALAKTEQKEAISSMFKDLPFPLRMAGKMIAPLLSNVAEEIAEQSRAAQGVIEEAQMRLMNDETLNQQLGKPLQVGGAFFAKFEFHEY
jgi:hypothetical protein